MKKITFLEKIREKILLHTPDFNLHHLEQGLQHFKFMNVKANSTLLHVGEICDKIFICEKSISGSFSIEEVDEKIISLEPEMKFFSHYDSFKNNEPSNLKITIYEDSQVSYIEKENLESLYLKYHDWALYGLKITEEHLLYLYNLNNFIMFNNATENYNMIEEKFPRFLQVVPLKHIASRLNVSPVTISRIRAERCKKN